jgi:hypothetical protein
MWIPTDPSDVSPNTLLQEKLNEAVMVLNKSLQVGTTIWDVGCVCTGLMTHQEINVQNMNVELVAQMFKNYQSNVLFHLEGQSMYRLRCCPLLHGVM